MRNAFGAASDVHHTRRSDTFHVQTMRSDGFNGAGLRAVCHRARQADDDDGTVRSDGRRRVQADEHL